MKTPTSFWDRLRELDLFYEQKDALYQTLRHLVGHLWEARIAYAVVGGLAVFAHGRLPATNDVNLLLTEEGSEEFRRRFVPKHYTQQDHRGRRFTDNTTQVPVAFLIAGRYPGSGKAGPIAFPDPAGVNTVAEDAQVVDLPTLIQLKLAARRYHDLADVVSLIRANNLDESLLHQLHRSLHADYIECLEAKRREDEYEAREG
jgi:hypothetical protein